MLMETKLISLTKENEEMLDEIVKSGMYATKSEVIRDAVRKLYADILRLLVTNINSFLCHHLDCEWMNLLSRPEPRTVDVVTLFGIVAKQSLGNLAPTGISGAEYQNCRFMSVHTSHRRYQWSA